MNNPISDLYIKFMETIEPYLKKYPYLFGIFVGALFLFGAVFKWKWVCNPAGSKKFMLTVYEIFGEKGFRFFTGLFGAVIMFLSLYSWIKNNL